MNERDGTGRRKADKHTFDRAALLVLVILYVIGFANQSSQSDKIRKLAKANAATLQDSQVGRARSLNANCALNSDQNAAIRTILLRSTEATKPFDNLYRQFGLPPYKERLKQAQTFAATLPPVDCTALRRQAGLDK